MELRDSYRKPYLRQARSPPKTGSYTNRSCEKKANIIDFAAHFETTKYLPEMSAKFARKYGANIWELKENNDKPGSDRAIKLEIARKFPWDQSKSEEIVEILHKVIKKY
ncbi:hypothetical protein ACOME3_004938 [Neoechinorhynchus agilis]